MLISQLANKKVAIWGYGLEGRATVAYLKSRCPDLNFVVWCQPHEQDRTDIAYANQPVTTSWLNQFDVVVKSPGISPHQPMVQESTCQIISSSALWFSNEASGKVIAVTGTKGKSTTSAMLFHVLETMGHRVVLAGNIGVPLIACLDQYDYVVLETSSYQAQDGAIGADLALLLNLYTEHLDWHGDVAQYHADKWRLLERAADVVLNHKDESSLAMLRQKPLIQAPTWFNQDQGFYVLNGVLMYQDKALMSAHGWQLKGVHNMVNAAAVCTLVGLLSLDIRVAINALKRFKPLPHRLEPLASINGVGYINDSIASTPHATLAALTTVDNNHTLLLVGGYDRGVDWAWWVEAILEKPPKVIICSGANGEKIAHLILKQGVKTQCIRQPSLRLAVQNAQLLAKSGDVILLSPGAPSFDAFDNYQHRGQQFKQWINQ